MGKKKSKSNAYTAESNPKFQFHSFAFTSYAEEMIDNSNGDYENIKFLIFQREKCPTTGKDHWQGYCELYKKMCRVPIQEMFDDPVMYIKVARKRREANIIYCSKEESRLPGEETYIFGEKRKQGERNDIHECTDILKKGGSMISVINHNPAAFVKYSRGFEKIKEYMDRERITSTWEESNERYGSLLNTVLWGEAGSGKTSLVYKEHGVRNVYRLEKANGDNIWWDGYCGQPILLIDDFYGWIKYGVLLALLDRYPMSLQIKGGTTQKEWKHVFITSNKPPKLWYSTGMTDALERRLTHVYRIDMNTTTLETNGSQKLSRNIALSERDNYDTNSEIFVLSDSE